YRSSGCRLVCCGGLSLTPFSRLHGLPPSPATTASMSARWIFLVLSIWSTPDRSRCAVQTAEATASGGTCFSHGHRPMVKERPRKRPLEDPWIWHALLKRMSCGIDIQHEAKTVHSFAKSFRDSSH